jgi:hypothetical protein
MQVPGWLILAHYLALLLCPACLALGFYAGTVARERIARGLSVLPNPVAALTSKVRTVRAEEPTNGKPKPLPDLRA